MAFSDSKIGLGFLWSIESPPTPQDLGHIAGKGKPRILWDSLGVPYDSCASNSSIVRS